MKHPGKNTEEIANRLAGELRGADRGLQIDRPRADWRASASQRSARRRRNRAAAASAAMLCLLAAVVWISNRREATPQADPPPLIANRPPQPAQIAPLPARDELLAMDRELQRLDQAIASMQRRQAIQLVRDEAAALSAAAPAPTYAFSDAVEEGALLLLAAAEKAARSEGKEAGQAIYRRVVEIFPETRSAMIARRELM